MRALATLCCATALWLATGAHALAMTVYYAVEHKPGPSWEQGTPFFKQPGLEKHIGYMKGFYDKGLIVMGGPFLDGSGGMMIMRAASLEEATKLANEDPAVKAGLLRVEVRAWGNPWPIKAADPGSP